MKLSDKEKRDLDKFVKFLALKATQIIVQSRLGERISTPCKPIVDGSTDSDWFNLNINDLPDICSEAKKVLNVSVDTITVDAPFCIEISLDTSDGEKMILEQWCLGLLPEKCDATERIVSTVYNRLGLLLKSLVPVTRVIPAYKLSRKQGPECFVICYRVGLEKPELHTLGDGFKERTIGQVSTPIGTVQLKVAYRTKMTMTPTQPDKENSMMVKSDHFNTKVEDKNEKNSELDYKNPILTQGTQGIKIGAFADRSLLQSDLIVPKVPFSKLLAASEPATQKETSVADSDSNNSNKQKEIVAEEEKKDVVEDQNGNSPSDMKSSTLTTFSADDFIMVDLKAPFGTPSDSSAAELSQIYREWQRPPSLQSFEDAPTVAEQVQDLTQQLAMFELSLSEYEGMVQSLCQSPDNN